jgi:PadR family transcriptional regulator PadR
MARKTLGISTIKVLHSVAVGWRYGFDVMDATGLPSGTVYPALSRLERLGFVKARWEDQKKAQREKRPPRKYYTLTRSGKEKLLDAAERIRELERLLPAESVDITAVRR